MSDLGKRTRREAAALLSTNARTLRDDGTIPRNADGNRQQQASAHSEAKREQANASVFNQAVLEIGLSSDPFPDLGKLVLKCQQFSSDREYAPGRDPSKVRLAVVKAAARSLQLPIETT